MIDGLMSGEAMMDFNILDFGDEFHSKLSKKLNSVLKVHIGLEEKI